MGGIGMSAAGAGGLISGAVGLGIFLIVLLIIIAVSCINIVPQAHAYVVERLGTYRGTWSVGFHVKMPFFDKIAKRVTLKDCCLLIRLCLKDHGRFPRSFDDGSDTEYCHDDRAVRRCFLWYFAGGWP